MRILAFASTDSYLKWCAGQLNSLPNHWQVELSVLKNPLAPSSRQVSSALESTRFAGSSLPFVDAFSAARQIVRAKPDYVFLAMPTTLLNLVRWMIDRQPFGRKIKIVSGFPGVAIGHPVAWTVGKGNIDVLVAHSQRELSIFGSRLVEAKCPATVALSSFPQLVSFDRKSFDRSTSISRFVFAPQPSVPETLFERKVLLAALVDLAERTKVPVIVKLRAKPGEAQTHFEQWDYKQLFDETYGNDSLVFEYGSIESSIEDEDSALLTVSSTAGIEAIALGRTAIVISDFGVAPVFENSGIAMTVGEINASTRPHPDSKWLSENYFHQIGENDLVKVLEKTKSSVRVPLEATAVFGRDYLVELLKQLVSSKTLQRLVTAAKNRT